ncbi:MFS transporter [Neomegalonema sp.]|uniref:MFS transporter n=1 Tax=Neomegalonema sp. TaxID=2039713 RepID=UPI002603B4B3|nr:MFS transporter [Neomegalonema sp.]MDD2870208.1 MFS transporter [Neomegalonema sp.]
MSEATSGGAEGFAPSPASTPSVPGLAMPVLGAMAAGHFLNDLIQAIVPAAYPMIQAEYDLDYAQIGVLTMAYQFTASLLQPAVGFVTDRRPADWALPAAMLFSLAGVLALAFVQSYEALFAAVLLVGIGSSIFHPEAARLTRMAAGRRLSFAQSVFQLGGYSGTAMGPLLVAFLVTPYGLSRSLWFVPLAAAGFLILVQGVRWGKERLRAHAAARKTLKAGHDFSPAKVWGTLGILAVLVFASNAYSAVLSNFYTFFLIEKFGVSIKTSQILLFLFAAAVAAGVFFGGLVGDRIGRRRLSILSILGAAPLALALPHVPLVPAVLLSMGVGALIASAFPSIVVMAQELLPRHVGLVTGGFFGLMFGVGGIAAAAFGGYADTHGVVRTFQMAALIPLLGVFGFLLPRIGETR